MNFETWNRLSWAQVTRSVRAFPVDLIVIVGFVLVVNLVFRIPTLREATLAGASLRTLVGVPALLFVPGYVLVAALFPAGGGSEPADDGRRHRGPYQSIDLVGRIALSFGMSVALLPLFALAIGSGWAFTPRVVLTGLTVMLAVGIAFAAFQRLRVPSSVRFGLSVRQWLADFRHGVLNPASPIEGIATLVLAIAVLAAFGAMGYAVATPYESGQSSTLYLLTENETGAQMASSYPSEFTAGEEQDLTVGVDNDEERRQPYTIVVTVERVRTNGTDTDVLESRELDRLHADVPAGEDWTGSHSVAPEMIGEDLRLHYYLYKGETAPSDPDASSAYRDVYIWIDVAEA